IALQIPSGGRQVLSAVAAGGRVTARRREPGLRGRIGLRLSVSGLPAMLRRRLAGHARLHLSLIDRLPGITLSRLSLLVYGRLLRISALRLRLRMESGMGKDQDHGSGYGCSTGFSHTSPLGKHTAQRGTLLFNRSN